MDKPEKNTLFDALDQLLSEAIDIAKQKTEMHITNHITGPIPRTIEELAEIIDKANAKFRAEAIKEVAEQLNLSHADETRDGRDVPADMAEHNLGYGYSATTAGEPSVPPLADAAKTFRCPDGFETMLFALRGNGVAVNRDHLDDALRMIAGGHIYIRA